jgi:hypothetical protein
MPIPTIYILNFPTWGSHNHFAKVKYMTWGPIGKNIVCFGSYLCPSPYSNSPPYLCFPTLVDYMHIIGPTLNVAPFFNNYNKFSALGLSRQPSMCVAWFPQKVGPLCVTSS